MQNIISEYDTAQSTSFFITGKRKDGQDIRLGLNISGTGIARSTRDIPSITEAARFLDTYKLTAAQRRLNVDIDSLQIHEVITVAHEGDITTESYDDILDKEKVIQSAPSTQLGAAERKMLDTLIADYEPINHEPEFPETGLSPEDDDTVTVETKVHWFNSSDAGHKMIDFTTTAAAFQEMSLDPNARQTTKLHVTQTTRLESAAPLSEAVIQARLGRELFNQHAPWHMREILPQAADIQRKLERATGKNRAKVTKPLKKAAPVYYLAGEKRPYSYSEHNAFDSLVDAANKRETKVQRDKGKKPLGVRIAKLAYRSIKLTSEQINTLATYMHQRDHEGTYDALKTQREKDAVRAYIGNFPSVDDILQPVIGALAPETTTDQASGFWTVIAPKHIRNNNFPLQQRQTLRDAINDGAKDSFGLKLAFVTPTKGRRVNDDDISDAVEESMVQKLSDQTNQNGDRVSAIRVASVLGLH